MQAVSALVNELQLGSRLNSAIESNRRGEFALLLSLLSEDARDMAQFQSTEFKKGDLRTQFDLGQEQPLLAELVNEPCVTNHGAVFHQGGALAFRLENAIQEEALVIRRQEQLEMEQVLANCDINTRHRYQNIAVEPVNKSVNVAELLLAQRQMSDLIAQA